MDDHLSGDMSAPHARPPPPPPKPSAQELTTTTIGGVGASSPLSLPSTSATTATPTATTRTATTSAGVGGGGGGGGGVWNDHRPLTAPTTTPTTTTTAAGAARPVPGAVPGTGGAMGSTAAAAAAVASNEASRPHLQYIYPHSSGPWGVAAAGLEGAGDRDGRDQIRGRGAGHGWAAGAGEGSRMGEGEGGGGRGVMVRTAAADDDDDDGGEGGGDPGPTWLPEMVLDKTKSDLAHLLHDQSLLDSFSASSLTTPPTHVARTRHAVRQQLARNVELATHLQRLTRRLDDTHRRTQAHLLRLHGLERAWRAKQADMDRALEPYSPMALYQRLVAAVAEQDGVCAALETSFLDHDARGAGTVAGPGAGAGVGGDADVAEFVRSYRRAKEVWYLRKEHKERWDEGRVGGWR